MSLDNWAVSLDVRDAPSPKTIAVTNTGYQINPPENMEVFECPECSASIFEIMEGEFEGKPVLGLVCQRCETHGAVFPCGL